MPGLDLESLSSGDRRVVSTWAVGGGATGALSPLASSPRAGRSTSRIIGQHGRWYLPASAGEAEWVGQLVGCADVGGEDASHTKPGGIARGLVGVPRDMRAQRVVFHVGSATGIDPSRQNEKLVFPKRRHWRKLSSKASPRVPMTGDLLLAVQGSENLGNLLRKVSRPTLHVTLRLGKVTIFQADLPGAPTPPWEFPVCLPLDRLGEKALFEPLCLELRKRVGGTVLGTVQVPIKPALHCGFEAVCDHNRDPDSGFSLPVAAAEASSYADEDALSRQGGAVESKVSQSDGEGKAAADPQEARDAPSGDEERVLGEPPPPASGRYDPYFDLHLPDAVDVLGGPQWVLVKDVFGRAAKETRPDQVRQLAKLKLALAWRPPMHHDELNALVKAQLSQDDMAGGIPGWDLAAQGHQPQPSTSARRASRGQGRRQLPGGRRIVKHVVLSPYGTFAFDDSRQVEEMKAVRAARARAAALRRAAIHRHAAITIQATWRGHLGRLEATHRAARVVSAAIRIQALLRQKLAQAQVAGLKRQAAVETVLAMAQDAVAQARVSLAAAEARRERYLARAAERGVPPSLKASTLTLPLPGGQDAIHLPATPKQMLGSAKVFSDQLSPEALAHCFGEGALDAERALVACALAALWGVGKPTPEVGVRIMASSTFLPSLFSVHPSDLPPARRQAAAIILSRHPRCADAQAGLMMRKKSEDAVLHMRRVLRDVQSEVTPSVLGHRHSFTLAPPQRLHSPRTSSRLCDAVDETSTDADAAPRMQPTLSSMGHGPGKSPMPDDGSVAGSRPGQEGATQSEEHGHGADAEVEDVGAAKLAVDVVAVPSVRKPATALQSPRKLRKRRRKKRTRPEGGERGASRLTPQQQAARIAGQKRRAARTRKQDAASVERLKTLAVFMRWLIVLAFWRPPARLNPSKLTPEAQMEVDLKEVRLVKVTDAALKTVQSALGHIVGPVLAHFANQRDPGQGALVTGAALCTLLNIPSPCWASAGKVIRRKGFVRKLGLVHPSLLSKNAQRDARFVLRAHAKHSIDINNGLRRIQGYVDGVRGDGYGSLGLKRAIEEAGTRTTAASLGPPETTVMDEVEDVLHMWCLLTAFWMPMDDSTTVTSGGSTFHLDEEVVDIFRKKGFSNPKAAASAAAAAAAAEYAEGRDLGSILHKRGLDLSPDQIQHFVRMYEAQAPRLGQAAAPHGQGASAEVVAMMASPSPSPTDFGEHRQLTASPIDVFGPATSAAEASPGSAPPTPVMRERPAQRPSPQPSPHRMPGSLAALRTRLLSDASQARQASCDSRDTSLSLSDVPPLAEAKALLLAVLSEPEIRSELQCMDPWASPAARSVACMAAAILGERAPTWAWFRHAVRKGGPVFHAAQEATPASLVDAARSRALTALELRQLHTVQPDLLRQLPLGLAAMLQWGRALTAQPAAGSKKVSIPRCVRLANMAGSPLPTPVLSSDAVFSDWVHCNVLLAAAAARGHLARWARKPKLQAVLDPSTPLGRAKRSISRCGPAALKSILALRPFPRIAARVACALAALFGKGATGEGVKDVMRSANLHAALLTVTSADVESLRFMMQRMRHWLLVSTSPGAVLDACHRVQCPALSAIVRWVLVFTDPVASQVERVSSASEPDLVGDDLELKSTLNTIQVDVVAEVQATVQKGEGEAAQ